MYLSFFRHLWHSLIYCFCIFSLRLVFWHVLDVFIYIPFSTAIHLKETKHIFKNIHNLKFLEPSQHGITAMAWDYSTEEKDFILGLRDQTVKIYDSDLKGFTASVKPDCGTGPVTGVLKYNE